MDESVRCSRSSGILAHITSLPSPYGIGDMGSGTANFLQFLARSGQSILQILPLGPTHPAFSNSPYMTVSAFAGNPLIISPELLREEGLLSANELKEILKDLPDLSVYTVDFDAVTHLKTAVLNQAFSRFTPEQDPLFQQFVEESPWLPDYCLFMALKSRFQDTAWYQWPQALAKRDHEALLQAATQMQRQISFFQFEQYIFFRQWQQIRRQARELNIELFGDIPIYVSLDSADVWANQNIFQLDDTTLLPTHVAGVPPDYFSDTGQKWGNPLYRWNSKDSDTEEALLHWWCARFTAVFRQVDIARIDHFRGFQAYWSIPADDETALNGEWRQGPGAAFFKTVFDRLGPLKIVAEDLGEITEDVIALRQDLGFPGMKILQFAFDGDHSNSFLPHNFESSNFFVYTGTHDNNTTVGWYLSDRIDEGIRRQVKTIVNREDDEVHGIHRDLIHQAMSSTAVVSIYPLQDVLGFGGDCRMNMPGTDEGNWRWRCSTEFLSEDVAWWLHDLTHTFNRIPPQPGIPPSTAEGDEEILSKTEETKS